MARFRRLNSAAASSLVKSSSISRSRSDCHPLRASVRRRQLRSLRARRKHAEQQSAYNPGRKHEKPRYKPDRDSGDNPSPRFHHRARNHHPSKVMIIAVEKMIPSAARAITAGMRASFA